MRLVFARGEHDKAKVANAVNRSVRYLICCNSLPYDLVTRAAENPRFVRTRLRCGSDWVSLCGVPIASILQTPRSVVDPSSFACGRSWDDAVVRLGWRTGVTEYHGTMSS